MVHDDKCEQVHRPEDCCTWPGCTLRSTSRHCHCGSRAYRLCNGCQSGRHLHHTTEHVPCQCDLCEEP